MIIDNIKYLIFDYGDVLAYPITGHWFITPEFYSIIEKKEIDLSKFNNGVSKASEYISAEMKTENEEYEIFKKVYEIILNELEIDGDIRDKAMLIARDFVYSDRKHRLYKEVIKYLEKLSKKYKLILLSDNWPCANRLMRHWGISKYFEKTYISSEYKAVKSDKVFFDYPINEFNIKKGEAIFIDDKEELLDIAKEKGLEVILMDRKNAVKNSKYKVIKSLKEI